VFGFEIAAFLAVIALALFRAVTERGEQLFPFFLGSLRKGVGVRRRCHFEIGDEGWKTFRIFCG
jgi:hypothetical protein